MAPQLTVPGKRPAATCCHLGETYTCNRRDGHLGRHAFIWWEIRGVVRAVWGEKYQREVPC